MCSPRVLCNAVHGCARTTHESDGCRRKAVWRALRHPKLTSVVERGVVWWQTWGGNRGAQSGRNSRLVRVEEAVGASSESRQTGPPVSVQCAYFGAESSLGWVSRCLVVPGLPFPVIMTARRLQPARSTAAAPWAMIVPPLPPCSWPDSAI